MFDIEKLTQLVSYILKKNNNRLNYTKLIKILYLADKESFNAINHSMTGDLYYSLPQGPVLSNLLDLIRGRANFRLQTYWDSRFLTDDYDLVLLTQNIPDGKLSRFEKRIIDELDVKFHNKSYADLIAYVHDKNNCPEWIKPASHGRSPITEADILKSLGRTDDEIEIIEQENIAYEREEAVIASLLK